MEGWGQRGRSFDAGRRWRTTIWPRTRWLCGPGQARMPSRQEIWQGGLFPLSYFPVGLVFPYGIKPFPMGLSVSLWD